MINDPSFWVSIAFLIFFAIAFKPLFHKIQETLQAYRDQVSRDIQEVQECVQEARLALSRAEDLSLLTRQQILDIQQNTDHQVQHAQQEQKEALAHLLEQQKKMLASHLEYLNTQAKKELRESLLSSALQEVKQTLLQTPLGIQPSFKQAIQECVYDFDLASQQKRKTADQ